MTVWVKTKALIGVLGWTVAIVFAVTDSRTWIDEASTVVVAGAIAGWVLTVERRLTRMQSTFEHVSRTADHIAGTLDRLTVGTERGF